MSWSLVDLFSWGETARAEDLQRRNEELNRKKIERGQVTEEWAQAQQDRFNANGPDTYNGDIIAAAADGAMSGLENIPKSVRGALSSSASWGLSFVPWWGWIVAAGVVFHYLGGFVYLRGILARR